MADNVAKGIVSAKQAGQMHKDANVQKQGAQLKDARRASGSGLSPSNSNSPNGSFNTTTYSNASAINSTNRINNAYIRDKLKGSDVNQDVEAKQRINRSQQLDKAIQVADKIPVANKYAKVAKLAKKVTSAKSKKAGMMGKLFGSSNDKPSMSEIEAANASEVKGEEYNPEDAEGNYTVKLDKKTKYIFLGIVGGIVIVNVLVCVLIVSAITGGGKESYLASHDNPSESDIEEAYNKDMDS